MCESYGHFCSYDKLPCKRYNYEFDCYDCATYDKNGRLRWVCKRFALPAGFSLVKQLSSEQLKQDSGWMSLLVPTK